MMRCGIVRPMRDTWMCARGRGFVCDVLMLHIIRLLQLRKASCNVVALKHKLQAVRVDVAIPLDMVPGNLWYRPGRGSRFWFQRW